MASADLPYRGNPETSEAPKPPEHEEEKIPLIPRKRMRKGFREAPKEVKRQRSEEPEIPEEAPAPRLTRAAIKAEEEAQEEMDVLTALTGELGVMTSQYVRCRAYFM